MVHSTSRLEDQKLHLQAYLHHDAINDIILAKQLLLQLLKGRKLCIAACQGAAQVHLVILCDNVGKEVHFPATA